jgi:DNA-binding CsgD family transcriptional regulator
MLDLQSDKRSPKPEAVRPGLQPPVVPQTPRPPLPRGSDPPARAAGAAASGSFGFLRAVIDRLWVAILVVDASGRILVCNAAAEQILRQRDGLMRIGDLLTTNRPAETRTLAREIATVAVPDGEGAAPGAGHGVARATRPSGLPPYVLLVAPFATADGGSGPAALVVVSDLDVPVPDYGRHLSLAFELTDAEIRVARALLDGQTPAEIARARGVRMSTVRSQVKAIFAKTGTARQTELVRLLSRMPSLR